MSYPYQLTSFDAYKAAYGLIYQAALSLAENTTLARGKVAIVCNKKLQQEVKAAITAASPADMGARGWQAANRAQEDATLEATEDAFADTAIDSDTSLRGELRRQERAVTAALRAQGSSS